VRLGGEDAFGGRVSPKECIIYDGNTVKIIGSKIDGRKELDYLGRMCFFAYHFSFSFSFFFLLHHCEIKLENNYLMCTKIFFI
jgi:hypothetical protein